MRFVAITMGLLAVLLVASQGPVSLDPSPTASAGRSGVEGVSSFLARAQDHVAAREYWVSSTPQGLQAPNRRHGLRTFFETTGVRVENRQPGGNAPLVEFRLTGLGRGEALTAVPPGEVTHHAGRVEIRREGLVEWFENSERGLEQGFTLAERPARVGTGDLVLELSVLGARASVGGEAVTLETNAGRRLSYGKLVVTDAKGVRLLARFDAPTPDRVRLITDDTDAAYPIVIDPLLEEISDATLESDQAGAYFGWSVASAGDVNGDGFDDVIVGAPRFDAGLPLEGAAFVFLGSAAGVADANPMTAHAQLEGDQEGAAMGQSVASAGDVNGDGYDDVIVGAEGYDAGENNEGAAFVFLGSAAGIGDGNPASAHARLEGNQASANMGKSVASAGDVNADGYDDVIVGASSYISGQFLEGAAFVFLGSAAGIADAGPASAHARLEADQDLAFMGQSVASAGDVNGDGYDDVIVGAPFYDAGQVDEGAAFVFLGSAAGIGNGNPITAHARLEADQLDARLGTSVASARDVNGDGYADVIVGAYLYDSGETDEGAAFVFFGSAAGLADGNPVSANAQIEANQANAYMGYSVASAGDINGNGRSEVIVGAWAYDMGATDEGAAFVFIGSVDGDPSTAYARLRGNQPFAFMGYSVASAGDVTGDGLADVIAGAYLRDSGQADEGAALLYYGTLTGIAALDLIYLEDFIGESAFPTSPEVDLRALGGLSDSIVALGDVSLVLDGDALNAAFVSDTGFDYATVTLDASPIASSDFLMSVDFDGFSETPSGGGSPTFLLFADYPSGRLYYALGLLPTGSAAEIYMGPVVDGQPVIGLPPAAQAFAIRSGSPFTVDMGFDRALGLLSGSIEVEGFVRTLGPTVSVALGAEAVTAVGVSVVFSSENPGSAFDVALKEIALPEPGSIDSLMAGVALLFALGVRRQTGAPNGIPDPGRASQTGSVDLYEPIRGEGKAS